MIVDVVTGNHRKRKYELNLSPHGRGRGGGSAYDFVGVAKGSEPAGWSVLKCQACALFENVMLTLIRNIIKIRPPEIEIFSCSPLDS